MFPITSAKHSKLACSKQLRGHIFYLLNIKEWHPTTKIATDQDRELMARYLAHFSDPSHATVCLWLPQHTLEHCSVELSQKRLRIFCQLQSYVQISRGVNCDLQWEVRFANDIGGESGLNVVSWPYNSGFGSTFSNIFLIFVCCKMPTRHTKLW